MNHDLIISGGTVIDGTGADGVRADVAVGGGRITRVGDLSGERAARTVDATGKIVTPGFVDLHTHLDAQIGWDPEMRPSSYHGVTTALIGNCGVTFAPCAEANRRYLAELMQSVEDIDADAIMDGLPWNWTSYGQYLDAVQSLKPALNVVGLAGHSAIRFEVMGDKSCDEGVQPDDRELERIVDLVKESVAEGAAGFSTSRFLLHFVPDGRLTPGTWADARETEAIQQAVVDAGGRGALFQAAPDLHKRYRIDCEMFERGAEIGCQVLFSGGTGTERDGGVASWREFLERNNEAGNRITSLCHTRPSGSFFGLAQQAFLGTPAWQALMKLPTLADRVDALRDPKTREVLISEAKEAGGFGPVASILHPLGMDEHPDFDLDDKASLQKLADEAGVDPWRSMSSACCSRKGGTGTVGFSSRFRNQRKCCSWRAAGFARATPGWTWTPAGRSTRFSTAPAVKGSSMSAGDGFTLGHVLRTYDAPRTFEAEAFPLDWRTSCVP